MGAWKPRTFPELLSYVLKDLPRALRRSTNALVRADEGITIGTEAAGAADAATAAAEAAQSQANDAAGVAAGAAAAAAQAAGVAGGKADVFIQPDEPAAMYQLATTLWIDTTGGANTPKRWNGTSAAWVAVTDKAATDAAAAAVAAASLAQNAKDTADLAVQTATAANAAAQAAVSSANGKNTIKFRSAAPTTSAADAGTADGDLWFLIPNVQTGIVTGQYVWMAATQSWVQQALSSAVLASIDAGKITTGTLVGITITGVTIVGATVTGGVVQTSSTGKRVVLSNNQIRFYGLSGSVAVDAGVIEGVPNGAASGMIGIGIRTGEYSLYVGTQALPTTGSSTVQIPGIAWLGGLFMDGDIDNSGGQITSRLFRAPVTSDASMTSTFHAFQIGPDNGTNLIMDNNEIIVRQNGVPAALYINSEGGNVGLGDGDSTISVPGLFNNPFLPIRMAAGSAAISGTVAQNANGTVNVSFPSGRFSTAPYVFVISDNNRLTATASNITATGCTLNGANWSAAGAPAGITLRYLAIQMQGGAAAG